MSGTALAGLLVAAGMHAGWNLLLKQTAAPLLVTWWSLLCGVPLVALLALGGQGLSREVWGYALGSAGAEAAYYYLLAAAYQRGDFSLVYPLTRGTAPVLLIVWAVWFLHETPSPAGLAGVAVLVLGLMVIGSSSWWSAETRRGGASWSAVGLALGVALCISIYSAIDAVAVRSADPVVYTATVFGLTAVLVTPMVAWGQRWPVLWATWQNNRLRIIGISCLSLVTYALVLAIYARAPVSYAGVIREVSILIGALLGWRVLDEPFGRIRLIGAALILAGIGVVSIGG